MKGKTYCPSSVFINVVLTFICTIPVLHAVVQHETDAEVLFPPTKLGKDKKPVSVDDDDDYVQQELNATAKIASDRLSGEAASLLFNDGYMNGGSKCGGVCVHPATCNRLGGTIQGGICSRSGGFCCMFDRTCNQVSKEQTSFFHSPNYPAPVIGTLICQHDVIILPGVCGVRVEFKEFNTTRPLDRGLCNVDQLLMLNSLDGAAFPRCGELTGYATILPVDARHNTPLTFLSIIQSSRETYKWSIKLTQMKCDAAQRIRDYPDCGKKFASGDAATVSNSAEMKDVENSIATAEKLSTEPKSSEDLSSSYVDNAFYVVEYEKVSVINQDFDVDLPLVEYLKQSHQAVYDGPAPNPNQTLCKNTALDILKEKLASLNSTSNGAIKKQRIIRGGPAKLFEYPWQVSIHDWKGHVCGGAILNEYSILTASHCFLSVAPVLLRKVKIVLGDLNINTTTETKHEEAEVHSVLFHSHFDPYYLRNDIAVIRTRRPMQFRPGIQPVCLPEGGNSYVGREAWISGWGAVNFPQGKLATHLQKVSNNVIENSECRKKLKIDYIYSSMICAVAPKCAGTCFGDSGGPLVVEENEVSRIVGIVSFGIGGCALLPYWPDVYTRVTEYLDWLSYATTWV